MKKIQLPDLADAILLTPAQMNRIHFAGIRTSLTPEQLKKLAGEQQESQAHKADAICHPASTGKP